MQWILLFLVPCPLARRRRQSDTHDRCNQIGRALGLSLPSSRSAYYRLGFARRLHLFSHQLRGMTILHRSLRLNFRRYALPNL